MRSMSGRDTSTLRRKSHFGKNYKHDAESVSNAIQVGRTGAARCLRAGFLLGWIRRDSRDRKARSDKNRCKTQPDFAPGVSAAASRLCDWVCGLLARFVAHCAD